MKRNFQLLPGRLWFINLEIDTSFFGLGLAVDFDALDDFQIQLGLGFATFSFGRFFLVGAAE